MRENAIFALPSPKCVWVFFLPRRRRGRPDMNVDGAPRSCLPLFAVAGEGPLFSPLPERKLPAVRGTFNLLSSVEQRDCPRMVKENVMVASAPSCRWCEAYASPPPTGRIASSDPQFFPRCKLYLARGACRAGALLSYWALV